MIESRDSGGAAAALPFDPKKVFGQGRAPVRVTVESHEPFRTTVAIYGGVGWIGFRKAQLAELGPEIGDRVGLLVEPDEQPREVEVPADLTRALAADSAAAAAYEALSYTHRKEYARWVAEGKRDSTTERVARSVQRLRPASRRRRADHPCARERRDRTATVAAFWPHSDAERCRR